MNLIAAGDIDPAQSVNWLLPPLSELIYGGIASIIIFALIYKFGGPAAKKGMADRTAKIQAELDGAAEALESARTEAEERARLLAEADEQAAALLSEGRERLAAEIADLEARAEAESAGLAGRMGDELRVEVSRISSSVVDQLVAETLDDATQQALIEDFIQKVGAGS